MRAQRGPRGGGTRGNLPATLRTPRNGAKIGLDLSVRCNVKKQTAKVKMFLARWVDFVKLVFTPSAIRRHADLMDQGTNRQLYLKKVSTFFPGNQY